MLNVTCIKIHSIILSVTCHGLRNFPPLIHIPSNPFLNFWNPISYYFLSLSYDPPHPTPTWPTPPHPTPTWHTPPYPTPSWPNPPLYDTPHPTPPLHHPPTPPYPTPPLHDPPTLPYPTPSWPIPPHPFMTHPSHPPHPTPSWPTHPTLHHPTPPLHDPPAPPHPTPPHNCKIRVQECYGGRAMCYPWHIGGWRHWGPLSVDMQPYGCFIKGIHRCALPFLR